MSQESAPFSPETLAQLGEVLDHLSDEERAQLGEEFLKGTSEQERMSMMPLFFGKEYQLLLWAIDTTLEVHKATTRYASGLSALRRLREAMPTPSR